MYANVQGIRGKKTSLKYVMNQVNADIVMLSETMTRKVSVDGCQSILPSVICRETYILEWNIHPEVNDDLLK